MVSALHGASIAAMPSCDAPVSRFGAPQPAFDLRIKLSPEYGLAMSLASKLLADSSVASSLDLLSAWIESQMAYRGLPGLAMGVIYDQELIWAKGFGYADVASQEPATPKTVYRIASLTKLFTATAIMQLRDEGKLQLDDPVMHHLPWFQVQNRFADAPAITIRHLLTHTSGLPREAAFSYWVDRNFPTIEAIREKLPGQQVAIEPESNWKYSNLALTLAGEVVAAVAGAPYAEYIQSQILDPLGMDNTHVQIAADHPLLATGYHRRLPDNSRAVAHFTDMQGITPAANMASNVEDLAQFAMLQFRSGPRAGKQVLKGSSVREMQRVHWLNSNWQAGRGLGFYVWRMDDYILAGHGGALEGYRTDIQVIPAEKIGFVVLTNADDGNPLLIMEKAIKWVAPALAKAAKASKPSSFDPSWEQYLGKYRSIWGDVQVMRYKDQLVAFGPQLPDPTLGMVTLQPLEPPEPHTFRMETEENFSSDGELAVFEVDKTGQVVRLMLGNSYVEPVEEW
jgi:CubicO group peptidase (beta-lactamase class C family)